MTRFLRHLLLFLALFAAVAEVFYRVVIPAHESPIVRQDPDFHLMQYDPSIRKTGLATSGRRAQQRSHWSINEQGWNDPVDFLPDSQRDRPAVVITGDSQIEGFYVEQQEHIIRRLESLGEGRFVGYSVANSGYKLAEYILVARYLARLGIQPEVFILFINRGDFWSTIANLGGATRTAPLLRETEAGFTLVPGSPYRTTRLRRLLRRSAFVRYVVWNANLNPFASGPADLAMNEQLADPEADAIEEPIYSRALAFTVAEIRRALPEARLAFLVDADRVTIMADEPARPLGTSAVIARFCAASDCLHLDLTDVFTKAWTETRAPLHFSHNTHWNAHAHDVAARALYAALKQRNWLR